MESQQTDSIEKTQAKNKHCRTVFRILYIHAYTSTNVYIYVTIQILYMYINVYVYVKTNIHVNARDANDCETITKIPNMF